MDERDVAEYLSTFASMNEHGEWIAFRNPREGKRGHPIPVGKSVGGPETNRTARRGPSSGPRVDWRISYGGRRWRRSRVNYAHATRSAPGPQAVGHVNGDPLDDRPTNLRMLSTAENTRAWHTAERRRDARLRMEAGQAARMSNLRHGGINRGLKQAKLPPLSITSS